MPDRLASHREGMNDPAALTKLIQAAQAGDRDSADAVYRMMYDELKRLAHAIRRTPSQTLDTTALLHEAWLRLAPAEHLRIESRAHFKHLVARAMRMIVVDDARSRSAQKRGSGHRPVALDEVGRGTLPADPLDILDLEVALGDLERLDPRAAKVVECRVFGGLDVEETCHALGVSTATVKRDYRVARAFLAARLA